MYICHLNNNLKNFYRLGSLDAAINAYSLAIAEDPSFLEAYVGRGNVHVDFLTEQGFTNSKYVIIMSLLVEGQGTMHYAYLHGPGIDTSLSMFGPRIYV